MLSQDIKSVHTYRRKWDQFIQRIMIQTMFANNDESVLAKH